VIRVIPGSRIADLGNEIAVDFVTVAFGILEEDRGTRGITSTCGESLGLKDGLNGRVKVERRICRNAKGAWEGEGRGRNGRAEKEKVSFPDEDVIIEE
jgi:hypothetical protein